MATIPERNIIIRKTIERYMDRDFEMVDEFVRKMMRGLENAYSDERLLTAKVDAFLDEVGRVIKQSIKQHIISCRETEIGSCFMIKQGTDLSDSYDSQTRKLERLIESVLEETLPSLENLREKVEMRDRSDSDINRKTRRSMQECLENIVEEYKMNSRKMMNSLDERLQEHEADSRKRVGQDR